MALTRCPTAVLSAGAEVNPHGSSFGDGLEGLNQGSTPLHLAAYLAREDVARILLSYGADRDATVRRATLPCRRAVWPLALKVVVVRQDDEGNTPLDVAGDTCRQHDPWRVSNGGSCPEEAAKTKELLESWDESMAEKTGTCEEESCASVGKVKAAAMLNEEDTVLSI